MFTLRDVDAADYAIIHAWPSYPPEFAELDYALRSDGWLAEFSDTPENKILIAEQNGEVIAFTILARTAPTEAEFRIALRADKIGLNMGRDITSQTLEYGYTHSGLTRIHLLVRMNNQRAISLYQKLGFDTCGTCIKMVNQKSVEFMQMDSSGMPNTK